MEATELRIGNWYKEDIIGGEYAQITPKDIQELFDDPLDDFYKPIPLTEEWLLKFGFTWYEKQWKGRKGLFLISEPNGIGICHDNSFDENPWEVWLLNCEYIPKFMPRWIGKVHQLQNLYFALTGDELTFKSE